MNKFFRLLNLIDEYNQTLGKAHSVDFLQKCANIIRAELVWDGWFCEGFGVDGVGYFPVN